MKSTEESTPRNQNKEEKKFLTQERRKARKRNRENLYKKTRENHLCEKKESA